MPAQHNSHESQETPSARQPWQPPEVEVLLVDQTESSTFAASDGFISAS
jgi:hypothetical protein